MLRKIKSIFKSKPKTPRELLLNTVLDSSTIVLQNTKTDFRVGYENRDYVTIGKKCVIGATFTFESKKGFVQIGNNVHLGRVHFICRNNIVIEDDVTMAWGITIYDHNSHSVFWEHRKNDNNNCYQDYINHNGNNIVNKEWEHVIDKPIVIQSKVWVGFDVTILKGVTVGEGSVIGAKSVVTKDVEPWTVVAGNPAVVVKYLPEYNKK